MKYCNSINGLGESELTEIYRNKPQSDWTKWLSMQGDKFQAWLGLSYIDMLMIILGNIIMTFGLVNIHIPSKVTEGGMLGMAVIFYKLTGISPGVISVPLDLSLYLMGFAILKKDFIKKAIFSTITYSTIYTIMFAIGPILPSMEGNPLLAAILGGPFIGVGCGLVVARGCVAGGDDCLALILNKKTSLGLAQIYLLADMFVLSMAYFVYLPLTNVVISLITTTISSLIIGQFEVKVPQAKLPEIEFNRVQNAS